MHTQAFEKVRFRNTVLICPIINGEPHVCIKHIVEDVGLNYSSALTAIRKHPRLKNYCAEWHSKIDNLQGYTYLTMPIRKLNGWLYGINIRKVNKNSRDVLFNYQEECDAVLFSHFYGVKGSLKEQICQTGVINEKIKRYERHLKYVRKHLTEMKVEKAKREDVIFRASTMSISFGLGEERKAS